VSAERSRRLPEIIECDGLVVRCFPASSASEFPQLPHSGKQATPAIIRRLFSAAAKHAGEDADCLVCETAAPVEGRFIIAVDQYGFGVICSNCARLGGLLDSLKPLCSC
jgi:hypothetical protein